MQQEDKKPIEQPQQGAAPEFEQVAVPPVDGLLKELEAVLASSRREDAQQIAAQQYYAQRVMDEDRYLYEQEMRYRARSWEEEEERRYRHAREMRYRELYEAEGRRYRRSMYSYYDQEPSRCSISCHCGPCREGQCGDCTEDPAMRRRRDPRDPRWEERRREDVWLKKPWPNF